jgi:hypothetical protein
MTAVATRLLDAVVAAVQAAAPGVRVRRRRNTPRVPLYTAADSLPMLSVSCGEPEGVEVLTGGPGAEVAVKYPVWVAYLVAEATLPNAGDDTPDIREKREAVRRALGLLQPADMPGLNDVFVGAKSPFQPGDAGKAVVASVMTFTVECIEDRG